MRLAVACLAIVVVLLASNLPSAAQTVRVRTGDHPGYTRVVLSIDPGRGWDLIELNDGYAVRLAYPVNRFSVGDFFGPIGRDRVTRVEPRADAGIIAFGLACTCGIDVAVLPNALVLDFRDTAGAADGASQIWDARIDEAATIPVLWMVPPIVPPDPPEAGGVTRSLPRQAPIPKHAERDDTPTSPFPDLPLTPEEADTVFVSQLARARPLQSVPDPDPSTAPFQTESEQSMLFDRGMLRPKGPDPSAKLILRLSEQLGRASSQGLLASEDLREASAQSVAAQRARSSGDLDATNLRIRTIFDADAFGIGRPPPVDDLGTACPSEAVLDLTNWGTDVTAPDAIGPSRSRLLGEFDNPDPEAVRGLVRLYLFLGFGAEARQVIATYPRVLIEGDLLVGMAALVDGDPAPSSQVFKNLTACDGAVALWSLLAEGSEASRADINVDAILRTFSGLPQHHRAFLVQRLAEIFVEIGDLDSATSARNAATRTGLSSPGVALANATLDRATGGGPVDSNLAGLARSSASEAAVAMMTRLDILAEHNAAATPEDLDLAAALAFERRGTALGHQLKEAELRARIRNGAARDVLAELPVLAQRREINANNERHLVNLGLRALATDGGPADVLPLVLVLTDEEIARLEASTLVALGERLLALGFAQEADDLFRARRDAGWSAVWQAELLLALGRVDEAASLVRRAELDLGAPELAARTHEAAANYAEALRLHESAGAIEQAGRTAWRGQIWDRAAELAGDDTFDARPLLVPERSHGAPGEIASAGDDAVPSLAAASAMIEESAAARDRLGSLLEQIPQIP
ncbi:MAG: hypothetical protein AAFR35_13410 [Pseudomonadota bacterium]